MMKIKKIAVLFVALLSVCMAQAQEKKLFTLEDLNFGGKNYRQMTPKRLSLWWDGNKLVNADTLRRPSVYPSVYSSEQNIYVKMSEDAEPFKMTEDGTRQIVYGEAVHRNEFGIEGGIFLSPDKKSFAFYRMDQSMVTDYPQVNTFARSAEYEPDAYPMAGMTLAT